MDVRIPWTRQTLPETNTSFVVVNPKSLLTPDLLLHFDESTGFRDSSVRNHTININGNPIISTAQSVFGGASGRFGVVTTDSLAITDNVDDCLSFHLGDFTVDFRVRFVSVGANNHLITSGQGTFAGGNPYFVIGKSALDAFYFAVPVLGAIIGSTTTAVIDTWYHIAATRQAGAVRMFVNGTQEGGTSTLAANYNFEGTDFRIADGGFEPACYLDELRIIKGYAAWTSDFTPPTAPYTTIG